MRTLLVAAAAAVALSLNAGPSPAEQAARKAREAIAKQPQNAQHYNALAIALSRRARETADPAYYDEARKVLATSLQLDPGNTEARKIQGWLCLGKHEFAEALKIATELRKVSGDDEMVYGLLTDANVELGNYKEAEEAAQWMLNVGRSSVPGLLRAAYLRELFGDIEGSLELLGQVFGRLPASETEERAWTLTHIAHLLTMNGKHEEASQALEEALRLVPEYHYALGGLAKVRSEQGRHGEAVDLQQRRYKVAPHPENLFELGAALQKAARNQDAKKVFADFETKALAESEGWDNSNRELVFYYTDYSARPTEALRIAQREFSRRRDVFTLDAYAWALHRNGRSREALTHIEAALAVGITDPRILYHAGAIAAVCGRTALAHDYLQRSLRTNSKSEVAGDARTMLGRLSRTPRP